jgi:hypothetical protein
VVKPQAPEGPVWGAAIAIAIADDRFGEGGHRPIPCYDAKALKMWQTPDKAFHLVQVARTRHLGAVERQSCEGGEGHGQQPVKSSFVHDSR